MKKVLIVDDDPLILTLVEAIVKEEGFEAVLAEDGTDALDILTKDPHSVDFDLLILDIIMPKMNGLELLSQIKKLSHTKSIPVIMLTGEDKAEDIMNGYAVGADYYVTKPFTRQQLVYGIKLILGE